MTPLRLIFMGTPEFALPTLKTLVGSGHQVVAVYTQPPRPAGRGQKEKLSPVHAYALSKQLAVFTPSSLKAEEIQEAFRGLEADAAIVAAYGLLLPRAILEGTKMGCINVHPSDLPRWRGAAPIQRTVMAGDSQTAIVIMRMNEGLDTGDSLRKEYFAVTDGISAGALHDMLAEQAGPMVLETLEALARGNVVPQKQSEDGVTYAKKIAREECRIDWHAPAQTIRQKILGLSPAPGAFFVYQNETIKILDAELATGIPGEEPGTVTDSRLTIQCAEGAICPLRMQRPGKKPMTARELLAGYPLPPGTRLE